MDSGMAHMQSGTSGMTWNEQKIMQSGRSGMIWNEQKQCKVEYPEWPEMKKIMQSGTSGMTWNEQA